MQRKVTKADQHQSLSGERPFVSRAVFTFQFPRALQKNLLVLSASQSVAAELSQAFQCQQLAFRQEFASELLHFPLLPSHSGLLPFNDVSGLLAEIIRGSFCGLIAIPPASTWSRARNSGIRGPSPLRCRYSPLGFQGLPPTLLRQVREHTEALAFCVMALDVWCRSVRRVLSSSSWRQKTEEVSFTSVQLRFGSLQK